MGFDVKKNSVQFILLVSVLFLSGGLQALQLVGGKTKELNLIAYGDSIVVGGGASDYAHSWAGLIPVNTNNGVSGAQVAESSLAVQSLSPSLAKTYIVMVGTNDHRTYKDDATKQGFFKSFYRQTLAWLSMPDKVYGRDMSKTGTWADTPVNSFGSKTTEIGATATGSVSGTEVFVCYIIQNSGSANGIATVKIDDVTVDTLYTYGAMNTVNGLTYSSACERYSGLTDTSHEVVITQTANQVFYVEYIAGGPQNPPRILVSNVIIMSDAAYITYGTSLANVQAYNSIIDALMAEFPSVKLIDNYSDISASELSDGVHPNDTGHAIIEANYLEYLP